MIKIHLDFNVKGKARPRFDRRTARAYLPSEYVLNKENVSAVLEEVLFDFPLFFDPVARFTVRVLQFRKRPKLTKAEEARYNIEHPYGSLALAGSLADTDNMVGTLMDAAQGLVYADDKQVVSSKEDRVWMPKGGAYWEICKLEKDEQPEPWLNKRALNSLIKKGLA